MTKALRVKDWSKHYENNRSREIKQTTWFPVPNSLEGRGFMELMDHPAGLSHYGAWILLLSVASKMPMRGELIPESGRPHDARSIAMMCRGPRKLFEEAIARLVAIGWVEEFDISADKSVVNGPSSAQSPAESAGRLGSDGAGKPQPSAGIPQQGAAILPLKGNVNMKGGGEFEPPPPHGTERVRKHLAHNLLASDDTAMEEWRGLADRAKCVTVDDVCRFITWIKAEGVKAGIDGRYAPAYQGLLMRWHARRKDGAA